jgi:hypothetical protein
MRRENQFQSDQKFNKNYSGKHKIIFIFLSFFRTVDIAGFGVSIWDEFWSLPAIPNFPKI